MGPLKQLIKLNVGDPLQVCVAPILKQDIKN